MHRSGTSVATRLVNLLGVPTCIEADLFPPGPDNPRGNWESSSLTAFNDRLLGALGCDWTCPAALTRGWEEDPWLDWLYNEAAALFPRIVPTDHWVWKDPRNCVTLPFWARCLGSMPVVVLVNRHPLEIAASLERRGEFETAQSLALWERYLRLALNAISGTPCLVTHYQALLADPLAWCAQAALFLDRLRIPTSGPRREDVLSFVDARLRHVRLGTEDVLADGDVSAAQRALFLALHDLTGSHDALRAPVLPDETESTETFLADRRGAVRSHPSWTGA
jgi:hypothetical protein